MYGVNFDKGRILDTIFMQLATVVFPDKYYSQFYRRSYK
jgi:hypothetical protein